MSKNLYIVHCIDTEGPLYESIDATFERLNEILGIKIEPNVKTLHQIQSGKLDLGGKEGLARRIFAPELLDYNDTWHKLDVMLDELLSGGFRNKYKDSTGNGWCYSWFIIDHVGFDINPRRRDIGYHNIFDQYTRRLRQKGNENDDIQWHFHPMSTYREAHICATSYLRSPHLLETLCRRVIDRKWFPSCFRAGFHTERPDSHWFLEQWIPFDFSNQAMSETDLEKEQLDISKGRFGDWRRAPADWSHYHPSCDDYQVPGNCNRVIFRCLNVGTRLRLLDLPEVKRAFSRANDGLPTVLSFTNHDFRDMRKDVHNVYSLIKEAAKEFPDVTWQHCGAKKTAQSVLGYGIVEDTIDIDVKLHFGDKSSYLSVTSNKDTFGPQPFLAIKTLDKRYLTDNFDFQESRRHWTYTFDIHTVPLESIESIGVASNASDGSCCVVLIDAKGSHIDKVIYR